MKNEQLDEFLYKNRLKSSDLVEYWGVTKGVVSQILNGTTKLPAKRLAELLNNDRGWDVSMLMDLDQPENPVKEEPEEKRMIDTLLFLVESQKKDIETLIQLVKEKDTKIDELLTLAQDKDERIEELLDEINARKRGDATGAARSSSASAI